MHQLLDIIQNLESAHQLEGGISIVKICEEYGMKNQIVSSIRISEEKLQNYTSSYCVDTSASKSGGGGSCKHMKTDKDNTHDIAVVK